MITITTLEPTKTKSGKEVPLGTRFLLGPNSIYYTKRTGPDYLEIKIPGDSLTLRLEEVEIEFWKEPIAEAKVNIKPIDVELIPVKYAGWHTMSVLEWHYYDKDIMMLGYLKDFPHIEPFYELKKNTRNYTITNPTEHFKNLIKAASILPKSDAAI